MNSFSYPGLLSTTIAEWQNIVWRVIQDEGLVTKPARPTNFIKQYSVPFR